MASNIVVYGIHPDLERVEKAVLALKDAGFRNTDVSVPLPETVSSKDLAVVKATKAPEGVAAGAGTGGVLGGALGWLAVLGAVTVPGVGPLLAAGPVVAALAGVGARGALGALTGSLIGLGMPEYEAKRFEGRIRKGGILLSVHCDDSDWAEKAKDTLRATEAEDVSSGTQASADYAKSKRPVPRSSTSDPQA